MAIFHVLVLQMLLVSLFFSDLGPPWHSSHTFSLVNEQEQRLLVWA